MTGAVDNGEMEPCVVWLDLLTGGIVKSFRGAITSLVPPSEHARITGISAGCSTLGVDILYEEKISSSNDFGIETRGVTEEKHNKIIQRYQHIHQAVSRCRLI